MRFKRLYTQFKTILINILFQKDSYVRTLETITPQQFRAKVKSSLHSYALFSYQDPLVKALIWNCKFRRNTKCITLAASLIYEKISSFTFLEPPIVIVPIPLSPSRKRHRGYNQTETIATYILKHDTHSQFTLSLQSLKRKDSLSQTRLSKQKRITNLKNTFYIDSPQEIEGKDVILFDDVTTTGATLEEARAVLQPYARTVICLAIAH